MEAPVSSAMYGVRGCLRRTGSEPFKPFVPFVASVIPCNRFPGCGSVWLGASSWSPWMIDADSRQCRALLYPIYKSTHEPGDVITTDYPNTTAPCVEVIDRSAH